MRWIATITFLALLHFKADCAFIEHDHERIGVHRLSKRAAESTYADWMSLGNAAIEDALRLKPILNHAKNVIIFIGDGMGISTQTAATFLKSHQDQTHQSETKLSWNDMPYLGLSKTYNTNFQTPDSAGTATAILCGQKTRARSVGVDQRTENQNCDTMKTENKLKSILKYSHEANKWTGVVTTSRLTHATPASSYAHSPERNWEYDAQIPAVAKGKCKDIAKQLIEENEYIRVLLGGGRQQFLGINDTDPEHPSIKGLRTDGENLLQSWLNKKKTAGVPDGRYQLVFNKTQFESVNPESTDYLFGVFQPGHMCYELDRVDNVCNEPSLKELTEKAVNILKRSNAGYFLLVEGGRIDHGHHDAMAKYALTDTLALSEAVKSAMDMTNEQDTLIIVTADHSHVFTMGGYSSMGSNVLDVTDYDLGADQKPYTILGYANGPGFYYHRTVNKSLDNILPRKNLTGVDTNINTFKQDAGVPLVEETHGGEEVAIYARGPYAHLIHSIHEQSYIGHVMMYATCLGPYQCPNVNGASLLFIDSKLFLLLFCLLVLNYF